MTYPTHDAPLPVEVVQPSDDAEHAKDRENVADGYARDDLEQYKRAADAGWHQFRVALWALILSFISIIFLYQTYKETRKSAEAAQRALWVTLSTERPYLFFKSHEVFINYEPFNVPPTISAGNKQEETAPSLFEWSVENSGRSQAILESAKVVVRVYSNLPETPDFSGAEEIKNIIISPNSGTHKKKSYTRDKLAYDGLKIYVIGRIIYRTGSNFLCETGICYTFDKDDNPEVEGGAAYNYNRSQLDDLDPVEKKKTTPRPRFSLPWRS